MGASNSQPQASGGVTGTASAARAQQQQESFDSASASASLGTQALCPSLVRLVGREPVPVGDRDFWFGQLSKLETQLSELQPDALAEVILASCARLATNHPFSENLRALIAVATDELLTVLAQASSPSLGVSISDSASTTAAQSVASASSATSSSASISSNVGVVNSPELDDDEHVSLETRVDGLLALLFLCRVFVQYLLAVCPEEDQRRHFDILNSLISNPNHSSNNTNNSNNSLNGSSTVGKASSKHGSTRGVPHSYQHPSQRSSQSTGTGGAATAAAMDLESGTPSSDDWSTPSRASGAAASALWGSPSSLGSSKTTVSSSSASSASSASMLSGWFGRRQAISVEEPEFEDIHYDYDAPLEESSLPGVVGSGSGFGAGSGAASLGGPTTHSKTASVSASQARAQRLETLFRSAGLLNTFVESTVRASVRLPTAGALVDLKVELLNVLLVLLSSQMYSDPEDPENNLRFFRMLPKNLSGELVPLLLRQYALGEDPTFNSHASTSHATPGPHGVSQSTPTGPNPVGTSLGGARRSVNGSHNNGANNTHSFDSGDEDGGGVRSTLKRAARGAVVTAVSLLLWPLRLPVRLFRLLFRADEVAVQALSRRALMLLVILVNQPAFPEYRRALGAITDSDRLELFGHARSPYSSASASIPSSSLSSSLPSASLPPPLSSSSLSSSLSSSSATATTTGSSAEPPTTTTDEPETSPVLPGSFSFDTLFGVFCRSIREQEPDLLLLYSMLVSNAGFREYVLARSDIDALVLPMLQRLYQDSAVGRDPGAAPGLGGDLFDEETGGGGAVDGLSSSSAAGSAENGEYDPSAADSDSEELEARRRHVYVLLIVLLLLSEDVAFCESAHSRVHVPAAAIRPWLNRERSPAAASLLSSSAKHLGIGITGGGGSGIGGGSSRFQDFLRRGSFVGGFGGDPGGTGLGVRSRAGSAQHGASPDAMGSSGSVMASDHAPSGLGAGLRLLALPFMALTGLLGGRRGSEQGELPLPGGASGSGSSGGGLLSRIKAQSVAGSASGISSSTSGSGGGGCSLGSLVFVVLLRMLAVNLTHDQYIHSNCVGVLSNLARHTSGLHPYAAHRLVRLLQLLARRFLRVAIPPPPLQHLKAARPSHLGRVRSDSERWEEEERAAAQREGPTPEAYYQKRLESAREADAIITAALRIVTDSLGARHIASNSYLVYELLYNRGTAIEPFRSHRRYWGKVEQLCAIVYHFNTCVNEAIERPDNTVEGVLAAIHHAALLWRADVLVGGAGGSSADSPDDSGGANGSEGTGSSRFRYQEAPDSAVEFFLPYIWSLIYRNQVVPSFPAEMHERGQRLETAEQHELARAVLGGPGEDEDEQSGTALGPQFGAAAVGGGYQLGDAAAGPPGEQFGQPWVLPARPPGSLL